MVRLFADIASAAEEAFKKELPSAAVRRYADAKEGFAVASIGTRRRPDGSDDVGLIEFEVHGRRYEKGTVRISGRAAAEGGLLLHKIEILTTDEQAVKQAAEDVTTLLGWTERRLREWSELLRGHRGSTKPEAT
jgi:hypothetical protein